MKRKGIVKIAAITLGISLLASSAAAYIPSLSYLLQRYVQGRIERKLSSLKVVLDEQKLVGQKWHEGSRTIWLSAPFKMRSEYEADDTKIVRIRSGYKQWQQKNQQQFRPVTSAPDLIADFFACAEEGKEDNGSARDRLMKYFSLYKIDKEKIVLTRFDGRIAILIGADPWDKSKPQLWLDKDGLFPLRFIYHENGQDAAPLIDLQLRGFGGAKGGTIFPDRIEKYRDGVLLEKSVLRELQVSPKLSAKMFRPS